APAREQAGAADSPMAEALPRLPRGRAACAPPIPPIRLPACCSAPEPGRFSRNATQPLEIAGGLAMLAGSRVCESVDRAGNDRRVRGPYQSYQGCAAGSIVWLAFKKGLRGGCWKK